MGRVVHFEIHADDPERAVNFYVDVFGWAVQQFGDNPYWLLQTGDSTPGIDGAVVPRRGDRPALGAPVVGCVCTVQVADLKATLANITSRGGAIALEPVSIPGVGTVAYCHDTEANIVGVLQP
jgi:predicted enzyme related to lactoylglutathione lyase